jgi:CelD/BcsL family acetyltransferase involved in cellulose biosynthesis
MEREGDRAMLVSLIDSAEEFDKVKHTWEDVYRNDPEATIFVSWAFIKAWTLVFPRQWLVLGLRPNGDSPYVAFISLRRVGRLALVSGGPPLADHTGFVCRRGYEKEAIESLAEFLRRRVWWNTLSLEAVLDTRLDLFLEGFSDRKYSITHQDSTLCPYIPLPESWEEYLAAYLHPKWRANVRRSLREVERLSGFSVIETNRENIDEQIEILLKLRVKQWGKLPMNAELYRILFRTTFAEGCLRLGVLKDNAITIGAYADFVDPLRKSMYSYSATFNKDYHGVHSPGQVVFLMNIRYAIEQGFKIYDFCVGGEDYKFHLGARERFNKNITIAREGLQKHFLLVASKGWRVGRRIVHALRRDT